MTEKVVQYSHSDLVEIGAKWLAKRCSVVVTEMVTYANENPDGLGFTTTKTTLIECKANRADFLADKKKFVRYQRPQQGMGTLRYYLCPKGLIKPEELPDNWGLLWVNEEGKIRQRVKATRQKKNLKDENIVLISAIRRLGPSSIKQIGVKYYTIPTKTATLGVEGENI